MSLFFLNDASLHGQFPTLSDLMNSLSRIFGMRAALIRYGYRLEVNRMLAMRAALGEQSFREVINSDTNRGRKQLILVWLDRDGPFWDDPIVHSPEEYFECENDVVTETALAEACCLTELSTDASVISFSPSLHQRDPLEVTWRGRADGDRTWLIRNFVSESPLTNHLQQIASPPSSWEELLKWANLNCPSLLLSGEILSQLPTTFYPNAAQRAQILLSALNEINVAIQQNNTARFEELRRLWFEGKDARITDSSNSEKNEFRRQLTFNHPVTGREVLCGWHAKIKSPEYRIHFEWPKQNPGDPLFVAYLGEKRTKR